jgi:hypothetical protein
LDQPADTFILDENHWPVRVGDRAQWKAWWDILANRRLRYTKLTDQVAVSTIFTGAPFDGEYLFQTLIIGTELPPVVAGQPPEWLYHWTTYTSAIRGHKRVVARLSTHLQGVSDHAR